MVADDHSRYSTDRRGLLGRRRRIRAIGPKLRKHAKKNKEQTTAGFEPTRASPMHSELIRVHPINHFGTTSLVATLAL